MRVDICDMLDYQIEFKAFTVFPSVNLAEIHSRFDSEQPKKLNPPVLLTTTRPRLTD